MFPAILFTQTHIAPGNVSGIWPLANSPYYIDGNILIPNDSTLLIDAGVVVEFQGHYALNVQGRLLAIGTETDTIFFTVNDTIGFSNPDTSLGGWNGIRFIDTPTDNDSSLISYCKLQFGKAVGNVWYTNAGGAVCVINFDKIRISNCMISHNIAGGLYESPSGGAIHLAWSDIKIKGNTFSHNFARSEGGAIQMHESNPFFSNNIFSNNHSVRGGAISIGSISSPTFANDQISNNKADNHGGGIILGEPAVVVCTGVTVSNNTAQWGGGIGAAGGQLHATDCIISGNRAEVWGGGVAGDFAALFLNNCTFANDTSGWGSGAVHNDHAIAEINNCDFIGNTAVFGGGYYCVFSQVQFNQCNFTRNTANDAAGMHVENSMLSIDSCDFVQNIAYNAGAAIQYSADTTEFIQPYLVELTHSRFELNYTPNLVGGVTINQVNSDSSLINLLVDNCIFASNSADHAASFRIMGSIHNFIVSNSIFTGNDAFRWAAGPFLIVNCRGQFINCLFSSNHASVGGGSSTGGGAAVAQEAQVDFYNCTFIKNASGFGGGLSIRLGGIATVMNSIFWDNTDQQISITTTDSRISSLTINNCNIHHGQDSIEVDTLSIFHWGEGNMDAEPLFVHPAREDYHLQDSSPCIGAGIDSLEISGIWYLTPNNDLEGNPRPNPAGSMPDMGAYESPLAIPVGIWGIGDQIPDQFFLHQNYPNPFNSSTNIEFRIPKNEYVILKIYNVLGEEVATLLSASLLSGSYQYEWNASEYPTGLYFYKLTADNYSEVKKMLLVR